MEVTHGTHVSQTRLRSDEDRECRLGEITVVTNKH
jgi:hypothetical protein